MTTDEARTALDTAVAKAVPGSDLTGVDPTARMRDELDIDSMDFLAIVQAVHDLTGVEVPEADYGRLDTVDGFVGYLVEHAA